MNEQEMPMVSGLKGTPSLNKQWLEGEVTSSTPYECMSCVCLLGKSKMHNTTVQ